MLCGMMPGSKGFNHLVLIRGDVRGPEFGACEVPSPQRYSRVGFHVFMSWFYDSGMRT